MTQPHKKGRILIGKPGLDGHERGAKVVSRALSDAGFEVIYTGIRRTPEELAATAVQEDVDAVGLSLLSGAHNALFPAVLDALRAAGIADVPVLGGGVIPDEDIPGLKALGIREIFTPGTPLGAVIQAFEAAVAEHRQAAPFELEVDRS
ncbi:MAG: cobalamin B12-binding domain-containing protein [Myxococcales bacterium]|jgi:methylmalonyl-CoA mutase C-terminal domain/subunit|nr:cobalamin B12-binding domain-containing protein [Myxococcales bacterium]